MTHSREIDQSVGARVRDLRRRMGITQTALGRILGVTFQQVQKYENGSTRIGASNLVKIAQALDVSPAYFFEHLGGTPIASTAPSDAHDETFDLNEALQHIPEAHIRRSVVEIVKLLAAAKR